MCACHRAVALAVHCLTVLVQAGPFVRLLVAAEYRVDSDTSRLPLVEVVSTGCVSLSLCHIVAVTVAMSRCCCVALSLCPTITVTTSHQL